MENPEIIFEIANMISSIASVGQKIILYPNYDMGLQKLFEKLRGLGLGVSVKDGYVLELYYPIAHTKREIWKQIYCQHRRIRAIEELTGPSGIVLSAFEQKYIQMIAATKQKQY